jgi:hypothetical protein
MPDLGSSLHLNMLWRYRLGQSLPLRVLAAIRRELRSRDLYGLHWGDPDTLEPLKFIRDRYVLPYVRPDRRALEIGPGGGRWTRYLLGFEKLTVVDYHAQLLDELRRGFTAKHMVFVKNNGSDFPGVEEGSIDYLFSFGTFVHLDVDLIHAYLANMRPLLKPGSNVVLQYSDQTKVMAQLNAGFSHNTPERMREMVTRAGYAILEEDLTTLWHSSVVRFTPAR